MAYKGMHIRHCNVQYYIMYGEEYILGSVTLWLRQQLE